MLILKAFMFLKIPLQLKAALLQNNMKSGKQCQKGNLKRLMVILLM